MARPTKYSAAVAAKIVKLLKGGTSRTAAVESAGVDYQTFLNWRARFSSFSSAVTRAEAECEAAYAAVVQKAAGGYLSGQTTRTTKTVFKTKVTKHPDGTIVEEPIAVEEVTETVVSGREFDWRAALEWLKRRRRADWGDSIDIRKLDDDSLLRLLALEGGGDEARALTQR